MSCKEPKCVFSNRFNKCILPNAYIETISECTRNKIKKIDCKYADRKEEAKLQACKNYKIRTEHIKKSTTKSSSKSSHNIYTTANTSFSLSSSAKNKLNKIKQNIQARKITNKFKQFITPFINRVSANLQTRINYYNELFKILDKITQEQCLNFYNETNGNKQYTLGDNMEILLSKQIGSPSAYGLVYLSKINMEYKKFFKFGLKIMRNTIGNQDEISILKVLSNLTLKNINPHFPILYKTFECNKAPIVAKDYPDLTKTGKYVMVLTELANGDLKTFIEKNEEYKRNDELIKNTMQQILISVLSFHLHMKKIHTDAHWGNFLYHKIKPGGYIHYRIFDVDIYIENMGYLWIIWDYMTDNITNKNNYYDYYKILHAFKNEANYKGGWVDKKLLVYSNQIEVIVNYIISLLQESIHFNIYKKVYDDKVLWDNLLKSRLFTKNTIFIPPKSEIINYCKPYILK